MDTGILKVRPLSIIPAPPTEKLRSASLLWAYAKGALKTKLLQRKNEVKTRTRKEAFFENLVNTFIC